VLGEYCFMDGGANGRPAWKATAKPGRSRDVYLVWTDYRGGNWAFVLDPAADGKETLARSTQAAITALPYELMGGSWTAAAWGRRGEMLSLFVVGG